MASSGPWGTPDLRPPPLRPGLIIVLTLLLVLPLLGYLAGSYVERQALADPQTRLKVALKAADSGYDRTALMLLGPLAKKSNAIAEYHLAIMYEEGLGTPKDSKKSLDLYTKAAGQSLVPAEARLGEVYLHGTMVLQDLAKARQWLEKAAMSGSSQAQLDVADIYRHGLGVQADPVEAYAWNAVAAAHGNALAASRRDTILKTLPASDQAKAQARADALKASLKPPSAPSA